jgi:inhibitor of KinA
MSLIEIESYSSPEVEGTGLRFYPISENAITLQFGEDINLETQKRILKYQQAIQHANMPGFVECVPAYTSLSVYFDVLKVSRSNLPGATALEKVSRFIQSINQVNEYECETSLIEIPVCYDEEFGLDLGELSKQFKISIEEIIRLHLQRTYTVYMIGFTPGFPYLGEIDSKLACSRKASPRRKVHTGSVAIAGKQTGIYPFDTPGGWQILGRTPFKLFSTLNNPPSMLRAGMQVKFKSISRKEFNELALA